jgi:hypothetical protein
MAVTRLNGFEAAQAETDGISLSSAVYSTAQFRTGLRSIRCNPASGASAFFSAGGSYSVGNERAHFGLYVATLPSVARCIAGQTGAGDVSLLLNSDGTISYTANNVTVGTSSTALSTGTWYWIGYRAFNGTSVVCLQIDGVDAVTGSPAGIGIPNNYLGFRLTEASAADIYIDDFIVDNAALLAPSKVDLALPISDNTVTGVTDNNGVATNIWQCVSNIPPAGVASANEAANPKKGMHFPASTTCNYLANLETYTTLGVGASDTVLAVQSIVRQGEDVATGTKNLQNIGALTNPTVAGVSATAGGDFGAHGAEVGLWLTTLGTVTANPTVTLGTSPTIRTSRISESRLACADFMAMYVAWTPAAVAANPPHTDTYPQLLAQ